MSERKKAVKEPLWHISKRSSMPLWQSMLIRAAAIVAALVFCGVLVILLAGINPFDFYKTMWDGAFGSERRIWDKLLHQIALLLCVALAVTPAFKMRYWNIGAEGQVLAGGLATASVMYYLGGEVPKGVLYLLMIVAGILAGVIWAVIPALFKAKWNTNETLFTLMMNYVAIQLVSFFINTWVKGGSGILTPMDAYKFPQPGPNKYFLNIVIVLVLTVLLFVYMRYSKHGYEISVVGESEKTARYIGINVKKVIIRTMILSGALCGIAGLLLVGGKDYTIQTSTAGGRGFTAIMVSWLAKFNPLIMIFTSFLVVFLQAGAAQVSTVFKLSSAISDIVTAIIILFVIGCEFFINYQIKWNGRKKGEVA